MNIVLVITDCLRYDAFSKYMKIKQYAEKILNKVYSPAPSTFFAMPSLMTGTLPFQVVDNARINASIYSYLPKLARIVGFNNVYETTNIVTSKYYGYEPYSEFYDDFLQKHKIEAFKNLVIYAQGAQEEHSKKSKNSIMKNLKTFIKKNKVLYKFAMNLYLLWKKPNLRKRARLNFNINFEFKTRITEVMNRLKDIIANIDHDNNFIFIHLIDTHAPYGAPQIINKMSKKKYLKILKTHEKLIYTPLLLKPFEIGLLKELYISEVEFLDKNLDIMLNMIFDKFGYENTLIVMVSDHGEAFGEHDIFTHPGSSLIEELLHVPLSIYGDISNKIHINPDGIYSSLIIHEIISKLMLGEEEVFIDPPDQVISIAYKRVKIEDVFRDKYRIHGYSIISDQDPQLRVWYFNEQENGTLENADKFSMLQEFLIDLRRKYLIDKLKRRIYGIKLPEEKV